ncbi:MULTISPECIES: TetR/AcrR family transcriptional regulator [Chitinibacter]|uniref:TetR/AcrR family transcriptional regulator n=1 Tax=Chitinibacter TaxID=230666 RepID=UPI00040AE431|nr:MULTISPECIES: TetR/AcrR family transcriptional regulator [Chitinibacter]
MSSLQPRAQATQLALLRATETLLATEGYAAWSEDAICQRTQLSRGALRYHFPAGRYQLLTAFARWVVDGQAERLAPLAGLDVRSRLYLVLYSLSSQAPSNATRALLELWMAARGDAQLQAALAPLMQEAEQQLLAEQPADEPELLALRLLMHGAALQAFQPETRPEAVMAALRWLLAQLPVPLGLSEILQALNQQRQGGDAASDSRK